MNTVFADTYYYLALVNEKDEAHANAEWILTELGDALVQPQKRSGYLRLLETIRSDPLATVVEASHDLFTRGVELFADRPDKDWSLTDCISFVVIEEHGVREALTGDHHFEQAGYVPLLV